MNASQDGSKGTDGVMTLPEDGALPINLVKTALAPSVPNVIGKRQTSFRKLGLFIGSPTRWQPAATDPLAPADAIDRFLDWCLQHLNARLGLDVCDLAYVTRSAMRSAQRLAPMDQPSQGRSGAATQGITPAASEMSLGRRLEQLGASRAAIEQLPDPDAYWRFSRHLCELSNEILKVKDPERAAEIREHVWLDHQQESWWKTSAVETLRDGALLAALDEREYRQVANGIGYLGCTLFAKLEITALIRTLDSLIATGLPRHDGAVLAMLDNSADLAERLRDARKRISQAAKDGTTSTLYLSWRLLTFTYATARSRPRDKAFLVHTPLLSLWTSCPEHSLWAPPDDMRQPGHDDPEYSADEAERLLTGLLPAVGSALRVIKDACGLQSQYPAIAGGGWAHLWDGDRSIEPPTFYLAVPSRPASDPRTYRSRQDPAIDRLIQACIGLDDPHAETLSWSIVQGDYAVLRKETMAETVNAVDYLLLPLSVKDGIQPDELDLDAYQIAKTLTHTEFVIGLTADDLSHAALHITERGAKDTATIEPVSDTIRDIARLMPTLPPKVLEKADQEFNRLQLQLGRIRQAYNKLTVDVKELEQAYIRKVESTTDFVRRELNLAPLPGPDVKSLPDALIDAHPFHVLHTQMHRLTEYATNVAATISNITNLLELLGTAHAANERHQQERRDRRNQRIVVIVGLGAVLVAIPTFVSGADFRTLYDAFGWDRGPATYYTIRVVVSVLLALAPIVASAWLAAGPLSSRIGDLLLLHRRTEKQFGTSVRCYWELADDATEFMDNERQLSDQLDRARLEKMIDARCADRPKRKSPLVKPIRAHVVSAPPSGVRTRWSDELDKLDSQASKELARIWPTVSVAESRVTTRRMWLRRLIPIRSNDASRAGRAALAKLRNERYFLQLFVLRPDCIPLPRTLCILRYKSARRVMGDQSTMGNDEYALSLEQAGYDLGRSTHLHRWLADETVDTITQTYTANQTWIDQNDVETVAAILAGRGVTASHHVTLDWWTGTLGRTVLDACVLRYHAERRPEDDADPIFVGQLRDLKITDTAIWCLMRWLDQQENRRWMQATRPNEITAVLVGRGVHRAAEVRFSAAGTPAASCITDRWKGQLGGENIDALCAILPPPLVPIETGPVDSDVWTQLETVLGVQVPAEYKRLIEVYGSGCIELYSLGHSDGCIYLNNPFAPIWPDDPAVQWSIAGTNSSDGNLTFPANEYVRWGTKRNGDLLLWHIDEETARWPVFVYKRGDRAPKETSLTTLRYLCKQACHEHHLPPTFIPKVVCKI